jgi:hypothetical protein
MIATDLGYRFIILISGRTIILRNQTQGRFDEIFASWGDAKVNWLTFEEEDVIRLKFDELTKQFDPSLPTIAVIRKGVKSLHLLRYMLSGVCPTDYHPTKEQNKLGLFLRKYAAGRSLLLDEECDDGTPNYARKSEQAATGKRVIVLRVKLKQDPLCFTASLN